MNNQDLNFGGINLDIPVVQVREERLGSFSRYEGSAGDLARECRIGGKGQGCCYGDEDNFSQNSGCMNGCAQGYLSAIDDALVITHGPIGCSADFMGANNARKWGEFAQGRAHRDIMLFSTGMTEKETVFGGIEKLRDTARAAFRIKKPAAIFICSTCVSAIIGEDINTLAAELAEEFGIPVVPLSCEGFKSKIWASGFDAAFHALLYGIVKPPEQKTNTINVINFRGSAGPELTELFAYLDMKPRLVAGFQTIAELSRMSEAAATVSICGTLGTYLGNSLEQRYGVPYVKAIQPHGISGFEEWLRILGRVIHKEEAVERYITEKRQGTLDALAPLVEKLKGKRALLGMGPSFAFNFARVLGEIGIEPLEIFAWHLDPAYDHGNLPESLGTLSSIRENLPVHVTDLQYNQVVRSIKRLKPDIYFYRHPSNAGIIMKLGVPAISLIDEYMAFGYQGTLQFARIIADVLANCNFERRLAAKTRLPYTAWWLDENGQETACNPLPSAEYEVLPREAG
jgi:nitrogenase molybdenum-iron protein alpha chain